MATLGVIVRHHPALPPLRVYRSVLPEQNDDFSSWYRIVSTFALVSALKRWTSGNFSTHSPMSKESGSVPQAMDMQTQKLR
jgi:hypothetical protein